MIRYYMGKLKIERITKVAPNGNALFKAHEEGKIGTKRYGFRRVKRGEAFTAPARICYRNKKRIILTEEEFAIANLGNPDGISYKIYRETRLSRTGGENKN
ncbi:MAG: hypothetical protein GY853_00970 [PVC group bacterium]|nr:hypothetical protein [PVC group bacterium]